MSDLVVQIVSSVLSGGASAATAFAAVFRSIERRLKAVETSVGDPEDPQTGLHLSLDRQEEALRKLRREIERWPDEPPEWMIRVIRRTVGTNSFGFGDEHVLEQRFKALSSSLQRLEKDLSTLDKDVTSVADTMGAYVKKADYDRDVLERSKELAGLREQIATSNGLLRGIMSALGYLNK